MIEVLILLLMKTQCPRTLAANSVSRSVSLSLRLDEATPFDLPEQSFGSNDKKIHDRLFTKYFSARLTFIGKSDTTDFVTHGQTNTTELPIDGRLMSIKGLGTVSHQSSRPI